MKRGGPLKRKTPLQNKTPMKRGGGFVSYPQEDGSGPFQKPRTPLKPISDKKRKQRAEDAALVEEEGTAFRAAIVGKRCVVCGRTQKEAYDATGLGHDAHHGLSKEALKKAGFRDRIWDPRDAVPVCSEPCHRRHTDGGELIPFDALPDSVSEFALELGMEQRLLREYGL